MKRFFVATAAIALAATMASAQDFSAAVELFNNGAQAFSDGNKVEAVNFYKEALTQFTACEEEEAAEKAAQLKELIPNICISIANDQIKESDFDGALTTLAEAKALATEYGNEEAIAKADEKVAGTYMAKGNALLKAKDFNGAADALKEAVALKAEDAKAQLLLGQALLQSGAADAAIVALEKAAELGETQAPKLLSTSYLKKGQALLKAGKNADAIEALEKSNSYVESANAYKLMANAYTKSGKNKEAIGAYKKYLEVDPGAKDAADINLTIAATAQKSGDKATAVEYYKKLAGTKHAATAEAQLKTLK